MIFCLYVVLCFAELKNKKAFCEFYNMLESFIFKIFKSDNKTAVQVSDGTHGSLVIHITKLFHI